MSGPPMRAFCTNILRSAAAAVAAFFDLPAAASLAAWAFCLRVSFCCCCCAAAALPCLPAAAGATFARLAGCALPAGRLHSRSASARTHEHAATYCAAACDDADDSDDDDERRRRTAARAANLGSVVAARASGFSAAFSARACDAQLAKPLAAGSGAFSLGTGMRAQSIAPIWPFAVTRDRISSSLTRICSNSV